MGLYITKLTSFPDRAADTNSGRESALWIKSQLEEMVQKSGRNDAQIYLVETQGQNCWEVDEKKCPAQDEYTQHKKMQPSIVLKIGDSNEAAVVFGAHIDTPASTPDHPHLPGAYDDGSVTVILMELARTLLDSGLEFNAPVYLTFNASEEDQDTFGSLSVVRDFQSKNIKVKTMMQFDEIGRAKANDRTIYLTTDEGLERSDDQHVHFDHDMAVNYLPALVKFYLSNNPIQFLQSNGGGSDNITWSDLYTGAKVLRMIDGPQQETVSHTQDDTIDKLSLPLMTDYLRIAFAVEQAGIK